MREMTSAVVKRSRIKETSCLLRGARERASIACIIKRGGGLSPLCPSSYSLVASEENTRGPGPSLGDVCPRGGELTRGGWQFSVGRGR